MTKENIEEQITSDYDPAEDPEFFEQAKWVCMDLGIPEDEAEMLVEDYLFN